jgi:hypothetical protein
MKSELQDKLYEKYPELFAQKDLSMQETLMCWGIECGDGWYDLLDRVCKQIQNEIKWNKAQKVEFVQVKEKYGGLRIYMNGGDDRIDGMIQMAESFSYMICDVCGERGKPNKVGWISTRCEKHEGHHWLWDTAGNNDDVKNEEGKDG